MLGTMSGLANEGTTMRAATDDASAALEECCSNAAASTSSSIREAGRSPNDELNDLDDKDCPSKAFAVPTGQTLDDITPELLAMPPMDHQISLAMRKCNKMVVDRQELILNPNEAASTLMDAMMQHRLPVKIDERKGMAAAFKSLLLNVYSDAGAFGDALSHIAVAQGQTCFYISQAFNSEFLLCCVWKQEKSVEDWNQYLIEQHKEAFPSPPVLEAPKKKLVSSSRKKSTGTTGKQILKNFAQLFNKIETILDLEVFKPLQNPIAEVKSSDSLGLKYNLILTNCNSMISVATCIPSAVMVSMWLNFYASDVSSLKASKKKTNIGNLDQITKYLLAFRKRGGTAAPLLTAQETLKASQLSLSQQTVSEDDSESAAFEDNSAGNSPSESETADGGKRKKKGKPKRGKSKGRKRVFKTQDGEFAVWLPDSFAHALLTRLNVPEGDESNVIDLTVEKAGVV
ncbi:hypothetical protein BDR26DRAFT_937573 [Obelidium mucronatum]|nr:hypothetical protein BDR26DRAFT_937573 [Obelidium mucronatum]